MTSQRQVRAALPSHIPYYAFHGDLMTFNARKACPGKAYLDPKEVLVRVYNATMAQDGGFSGEVVALGDHVDSFGINEFVFGGGVPCLQQYIVVKADSIATKPRELGFAEAARLYSATMIHEGLRSLEKDMQVLILGDMTGFAVQFAREKGCVVTSSEDFDCGEDIIMEDDNYLKWLEEHTNQFDVVIDATGDLDLYDYCEIFTTPLSEYVSINPQSAFQATKSLLLPSFLGGGTRKLKVIRAPKGESRAKLLTALSKRLLNNEIHILNPRIVAYENINTIMPSMRYVTVVNVIKQSDITPEEPDPREKMDRKGKGKQRNGIKHRRTSSGASHDPGTLTPPATPPVNPYSPRLPSRLAQSISAVVSEDLDEPRHNLPVQRQTLRPHSFSRREPSNALNLAIKAPDEEAEHDETSIRANEDAQKIISASVAEAEPDLPETERSSPSTTYIADQVSIDHSYSPFFDDTAGPRSVPGEEHDETQEQIEALQAQVALLMAKQRTKPKAGGAGKDIELRSLSHEQYGA